MRFYKKPRLLFVESLKQLWRFGFTSLRWRFTLIGIGLAIGPLLIVGLVIGVHSFARLEHQSLVLQRQVAESVGSKITAFVEQRVNELRLLDALYSLGRRSPDEQRAILSTLLFQRRVYQELMVLDGQGQESIRLSRSDVMVDQPGGSRSERVAFHIPISRKETYFSSVRFDTTIREPLLTIALPLLDLRSGQVTSVLVADLRFKMICELLAAVVSASERSDIYVTDEQGRVVAHRHPTIVLQGTTLALTQTDGL